MQREHALTTAPAVRCAGTVLVPVVRLAASVAAAGSVRVASGEAEVVGVWLAGGAGACAWLPARETPPDADGWNAWLAAQPVLLREIAGRLRTEPP